MRKIKVGIIQQANTSDIRMNLMNLAKSIEACAAHGAQLVVLQELHNSLYFCQTENTDLFELAEPIPGPSTGFYSELAATNRIVLVTSLLPVNIVKCIYLMIRLITKSFILLREILVLNRYRLLWVNWEYWFAGINGIPKLPV